ncbi:MAG: MFS transporter [Candidatus Marinimicrobia bacterium]|nr:MFS transporter [Candidatus Neomarinimicrobiota bacterium]
MAAKITYWSLIKGNRDFRNLWLGQLVSNLGDWFNTLALYSLIFQLSGTGEAVAGVLIAKLLPNFFIGPYAGVIVDRFDRKKIMIWSDILRGVLVIGFIFLRTKEHLWIAYTLMVIQMVFASFFEPARTAVIPNITKRNEIVAANALAGSTWSAMLALGAAIGGAVMIWLGRDMAFIIDSATFFLSAYFIRLIPSLKSKDAAGEKETGGGVSQLIRGIKYIKEDAYRLGLILVKPGLALTGGILTLFPIFTERVYSLKVLSASAALGFLYSARGMGAFIGPILIRKYFGESQRVMRRTIGFGYLVIAGSFVAFSFAPNIWWASVSVFTMTFGGASIWFFSTTLAHLEIEDKFRGRFFALELSIFTAVFSASTAVVGWSLDNLNLSPRDIGLRMSMLPLIPSILWFLFLTKYKKRKRRKKSGKQWTPVQRQDGITEAFDMPPSDIVDEE